MIKGAAESGDGADGFAEAISLTMYHRHLTLYENFDAI
jgi:hypothetical protein